MFFLERILKLSHLLSLPSRLTRIARLFKPRPACLRLSLLAVFALLTFPASSWGDEDNTEVPPPPPPTPPKLTIANASATEGAGIKFTVTLDKSTEGVVPARNFSVIASYTDGTATSGTDYTEVKTTRLNEILFSGNAGETQTFTVPTTGDSIVEGNETFTVGLLVDGPPSATAGITATDTATGTIKDDDTASVTISDASATEGDNLTFTVTLDKAVKGGLTVTPSFSGGTATANTDYTPNTKALSFSGTAGEKKTFTVATSEDDEVEGDETFTVSLAVSNAPSGVSAGGSATGTIVDDDEDSTPDKERSTQGPTKTVTIADAGASEGDSLTFTVTLNAAVQGGLTVTPGFSDGSATANTDYTPNTTALTFSGTAGEQKSITVATIEDDEVEDAETFSVSLAVSNAPSGVTVGDPATGTIEDDDGGTPPNNNGGTPPNNNGGTNSNNNGGTNSNNNGGTNSNNNGGTNSNNNGGTNSNNNGGTPSNARGAQNAIDTVTIADTSASEGDSLSFTVRLNQAVVGGLTVTPSFSDGTASGEADYTANTAALRFTGTAGEEQAIEVATLEDALVEVDETFTIRLKISQPSSGLTVGEAATGTILNDDRTGADLESESNDERRGEESVTGTSAPRLSVADVNAAEGELLSFTVSLDKAISDNQVSIRYVTVDGTAKVDEDYETATGTLTFAPGQTTGTVEVVTLDDLQDDGNETLFLRLSEPVNAVLADAEAVGTISNEDILPTAWISRYGGTVAGHVMQAVDERLHKRSAGAHLILSAAKVEQDSAHAPLADTWRAETLQTSGESGLWDAPPGSAGEMKVREVLAQSSFRRILTAGKDPASPNSRSHWTAWGSGASTRFDARENNVELDGDVVGMTIGLDSGWDRGTVGLALAWNDGRGSYDNAMSGVRGKFESTLTSVHPYMRWGNRQLSVWGLLGHGNGKYAVTPERLARTIKADMTMRMAGFGVRRSLTTLDNLQDIELALRTDASIVWMETDGIPGYFQAKKTQTSQLRLALEGSRSFELHSKALLTPTLELGLRHDGGDAENGSGVELGGGIRYENLLRGLTLELRSRRMVAHNVGKFAVWGVSGSMVLDPGADGLGLSLRLQPSWGEPVNGSQDLWQQPAPDLQAVEGDGGTAARLSTEIGYGLTALEGRGTLTIRSGFEMEENDMRSLRLGGQLETGEALEFGLTGKRTLLTSGKPDHGIVLSARNHF